MQMLSLLHRLLRNSNVTAQYAAAASALPRRSLPPGLARRASPHPPCRLRPVFRRRYANGTRSMATISGIKGNSSDALSKADNIERDERTAVHDDGDKRHTSRKKKKKIVLLCGDGPTGEEFSDDEEFMRLEAQQLDHYNHNYPDQDVCCPMDIFPFSTHRDGSLYRGNYLWNKQYRLADRNETRIEAMMLSDPKDCMFIRGERTCVMHSPTHMLQIFSLKLAKIHVDGGSIELYGYMAARDVLDPLLNYVLNVSRKNPIIVEQGSLIQMTGPKRGIELCDTTLIEFDMRIKTGGEEKDDLQLIDGVSLVDDMTRSAYAFTKRIHGDCGAIDITVSRLDFAVEATIEVHISEVESSFNLCVGCFTSGLCEEIQLFKGAIIGESCALRRSVVAAVIDTWMDVKLKVGSGPSYSSDNNTEHCCTFKTTNHGWSSHKIKVAFGSILVKVTWSTLCFRSGF